jgi:hypothetical protein
MSASPASSCALSSACPRKPFEGRQLTRREGQCVVAAWVEISELIHPIHDVGDELFEEDPRRDADLSAQGAGNGARQCRVEFSLTNDEFAALDTVRSGTRRARRSACLRASASGRFGYQSTESVPVIRCQTASEGIGGGRALLPAGHVRRLFSPAPYLSAHLGSADAFTPESV